jgi:ABC-type antimicrobial peptide transport system permease subunit
VNQQFADRYWPNQDPIGKRIRLADRPEQWMRVVGVTATGRYMWIGELPMTFLYLPFAQQTRTRMSLVVETAAADASPLAAPLRDAIRALDPAMPITRERTVADLYHERAVQVPGIIATMVSSIGALGLVLTLVGLYGLVAFSVAGRTREIGIRMAIGAAKADVLRMVLRQGLALSLAGIALGGIASIGVARALAAAMVGVGAPNPLLYVATPAMLIALPAAASYLPARRAARVDPLVALREE